MESKEKDIVYGHKYIKFTRGGRAYELFSKGICIYVLVAIGDIEDYKGSILDPNVDFNGVEDVNQKALEKALDKLYSKLSDLDDLIGMALLLGINGNPEWSLKLRSWCQRYNDVAKEFSRVYKTKVKVFKLWWLGSKG